MFFAKIHTRVSAKNISNVPNQLVNRNVNNYTKLNLKSARLIFFIIAGNYILSFPFLSICVSSI